MFVTLTLMVNVKTIYNRNLCQNSKCFMESMSALETVTYILTAVSYNYDCKILTRSTLRSNVIRLFMVVIY